MSIEATTEAIILDKEDLGEYDSRVFLYTKDLGRISAKTVSSRKITSKLASHVEPANYINARLVSKGDFFDGKGFQLVDALTIEGGVGLKSNLEQLKEVIKILDFVKQAAPEGVSDRDLWDFLRGVVGGSANAQVRDAISFLGFDPEFASCENCGRNNPEYFYVKNSIFVCAPCSFLVNEPKNQLIKI